jgi:hypothetical protein
MASPINLAHLRVFYSGGEDNNTAAYSLGGEISSHAVQSETLTLSSATGITGVTIVDGFGNSPGSGSLRFVATAKTLAWKSPDGILYGTAVDVSINGDYAIENQGLTSYIIVTVDNASLPGADTIATYTVARAVNKVFGGISKAQSLAGETRYRCLYVKNTHDTDSFTATSIWRALPTQGADEISIELDPAGIDGTAALCSAASASVTGASWATGTATIVSSLSVTTGDLVALSGNTPSGYNVIAAVTGTGSGNFTVAITNDPGSWSAGGTAKKLVETTAPSGVSFTHSAISKATALAIGTLATGQYQAFWLRNVVPAGVDQATSADYSMISGNAFF